MMGWVRLATTVVALEYLAALLVGIAAGFHYPFPYMKFIPAALGVSIFLVGGFSVAKLVQYILEREPSPGARLIREVRPDIVVGVFLVAAQMAVLGWAKVTLPHAIAFWADPILVDLDAILFFGTDPWTITHRLFGWASPLIDRAYITWAPVNLILMGLLLILPPSDKRSQALCSFFVTIAISMVVMYLLPSGGPVFYEALGYGQRFADLPVQPWVEVTRSYLWQGYLNPDDRVGSGISAMPSVHVAIALWIALVGRSFLPRFQALGWVFFTIILFGSVHLGWHYALDGLVAGAITIAAWRMTGVLVRPSTRWRIVPGRPFRILLPGLHRVD